MTLCLVLSLSPCPLTPALLCLLDSYGPPPAGSGDEPMINRLAVGGAAVLSVARAVLPRLRGLAVGFLCNVIFSLLTLRMLDRKISRYEMTE